MAPKQADQVPDKPLEQALSPEQLRSFEQMGKDSLEAPQNDRQSSVSDAPTNVNDEVASGVQKRNSKKILKSKGYKKV